MTHTLANRLGIVRDVPRPERRPQAAHRPESKRPGVIGWVDRSRYAAADFEPIRLIGRRAAV